jgi:HAD superfamily hydrolase (TIGR01509 family)
VPVRAVLFDFDGTLADSFAAITASTNHVRGTFGMSELPESMVRGFVGHGLEHLMRMLVPSADPAAAVATYRAHHATIARAMTKLLPGVAETIDGLRHRGYRLAICSNKTVWFTKDLTDHFFPTGTFDAILGPEDVPAPKPDPEMVLEGCRRLGVSENDAVYVGDMAVDVETGHRAKVTTWLVPGGASGFEAAKAAGPDRVLTSFAEILNLLPPIL